ncbi:hypothetical protein [Streptomyces sp. NPDC002671]
MALLHACMVPERVRDDWVQAWKLFRVQLSALDTGWTGCPNRCPRKLSSTCA